MCMFTVPTQNLEQQWGYVYILTHQNVYSEYSVDKKSKYINQKGLLTCLNFLMFWVVFNDQGWTACIKHSATFTSAKEKHKNQKRCILDLHVMLFCDACKGAEALFWALGKALVSPQSFVEMELPLPKTLFICFFRFMQNNIKTVPSLHWNSSISYLLLLKKHKCWSAKKSQKS